MESINKREARNKEKLVGLMISSVRSAASGRLFVFAG